MHFVFTVLFLLAGIKWGNWRRWKDYYPTILFFIIGDLLYSCLLYNHQLWAYQEIFFGVHILRNDLIISLIIVFGVSFNNYDIPWSFPSIETETVILDCLLGSSVFVNRIN
ncbi:hypothetical protein [Peribacillus frigoritolerans]|uniref:hypothetical protein n=1 Tax=Peribacillus frigoritolerans TaxID=450367 RepID=UPI00204090BE|nr:hypothetical protein [Peribacillus frigoritolerans]MCM3166091.1 hypothetical protein [Peribacillus frigoritolerans]